MQQIAQFDVIVGTLDNNLPCAAADRAGHSAFRKVDTGLVSESYNEGMFQSRQPGQMICYGDYR